MPQARMKQADQIDALRYPEFDARKTARNSRTHRGEVVGKL